MTIFQSILLGFLVVCAISVSFSQIGRASCRERV